MPQRVLIVDDEEAVCWSLRRAFDREGYAVGVASSAEEALASARKTPPDAIVLDVRLPGMDGLTAMSRLKQIVPAAPVIVITAFGDLGTAVRAVEGGAFDYLTKPFDLDQALAAVARALDARTARPAAPADPVVVPGDMIGRSPAMQQVFKRIALVAPREACVLITGESGTGKELVARAVHRHSARRDKPLLPVHIAALNPGLVESELFGHAKGAFTGAAEARPGLLSLADGGTVFLDELADIPADVQAKLLRVLEHNEVLPVGGNRPELLSLRVISATHQNLQEAVAAGRFRHDLYYRLNAFPIHLPPLRERGDDVLLLAEHFLRQLEPTAPPLGDDVKQLLLARSWFGNVRELRHALEHAVIVASGGSLRPEHFPPPLTASGPVASKPELADAVRAWVRQRLAAGEPAALHAELLAHVEPELLREVLHATQGNRQTAARWLGLARGTLRKLLGRMPE